MASTGRRTQSAEMPLVASASQARASSRCFAIASAPRAGAGSPPLTAGAFRRQARSPPAPSSTIVGVSSTSVTLAPSRRRCDALDHDLVAGRDIALHDDDAALAAGRSRPRRGARRRRPPSRRTSRAGPIAPRGSAPRAPRRSSNSSVDRDRHAGLQDARPQLASSASSAQRARRLVDAVVDAGDASGELRAGQTLRGRRDRLALRRCARHQRSGTSKPTRTVERSSSVAIAVELVTRSPTEISVRPVTPAKGAVMTRRSRSISALPHLDLGELRRRLGVGERDVGDRLRFGQRLRALERRARLRRARRARGRPRPAPRRRRAGAAARRPRPSRRA